MHIIAESWANTVFHNRPVSKNSINARWASEITVSSLCMHYGDKKF